MNIVMASQEKLRDAILGFLEHWGEEDAPTLSKAMLDPEVRKCGAPHVRGMSMAEASRKCCPKATWSL